MTFTQTPAEKRALALDREHQAALRQHWKEVVDPRGEFAAELRQRRKDELAERHARWAASQGGGSQ